MRILFAPTPIQPNPLPTFRSLRALRTKLQPARALRHNFGSDGRFPLLSLRPVAHKLSRTTSAASLFARLRMFRAPASGFEGFSLVRSPIVYFPRIPTMAWLMSAQIMRNSQKLPRSQYTGSTTQSKMAKGPSTASNTSRRRISDAGRLSV